MGGMEVDLMDLRDVIREMYAPAVVRQMLEGFFDEEFVRRAEAEASDMLRRIDEESQYGPALGKGRP
jgi:hypothetical protein